MPEAPAPRDRGPLDTLWRREVRTRLAPLHLSPAREAEIVDELAGHLEDYRRELIAGGSLEDEATRLALAEFRSGNLLASYMAPLRQSNARPTVTPAAATGHLLTDFWQDLRYSARTFWRQPGFTATAVLTLALGIGANTAIFSVVHGVLLESLPFADADRLYRLRMIYPDGAAYTTLSAPDFMSVREATGVFDQVEAYTSGTVTMLGGGDPREVRVASISDGLFGLLDVQVTLGRGFRPEENRPGRNTVAVLDYGFWQRAFGGDGGIVGRPISVGGITYSVVGVLAKGARLPADVPGARLPGEADLYLPLEYGETFSATAAAGRSSRFLGVLAKARPGVNAAFIDEDLGRIARVLQAAYPQARDALTMNAVSARELIVGDIRKPLLILLGAVGFVLLIACANVASLMLARASARREELTVRVALGAGRGRLLRQLLTEASVFGLAGGALGLALAYAGTRALVAAQPTDIPRLEEIGLDPVVMLFTLGIAVFATVAFGAFPALQTTAQLSCGLHAGARGGGTDRCSQRARAVLVVIEIALAVVLLTGAGLLVRSLTALTRAAPGFISEDAMAFRFALFGRGYDQQRLRARITELESELRALPGVTAVAATSLLPSSGPGQRLAFAVDGAPPPPPHVNPEIGVVSVSPDYFLTIGAHVVRGRDLSPRDHADAPLVAVINEAAVRQWFPNEDPIAKRVQVSGAREIVGVVADVLQGDPKRPTAPQLFVPYAQRPARSVWIVLRTVRTPLAIAPVIRATMQRLDPSLAVSALMPLDQLRAGAVARPRFYAALLTLFACVALALAVTGVFGVMSYTVAERTREIGIRMALGAQSSDVLRLIVGRTFLLASIGVSIGLPVSLVAGRTMQSQLFGVEPADPPTLSVVVLVLLSSAVTASVLPARRAARLDPVSTIRS